MEKRASLSVADVGLPATPRRRVRGLRREEVAALAGVSVGWYVYFEMGRADKQPSPSFVLAVARALRLDERETNYLVSLSFDDMPIVEPWQPAPEIRGLVSAFAGLLGPKRGVRSIEDGLRVVHEALTPEVGTFFLSVTSSVWRCRYAVGRHADRLDGFEVPTTYAGVRAMQRGKSIEMRRAHPNLRSAIGDGSVLTTPLFEDGRAVGAVGVVSSAGRRFSLLERRGLEAAALLLARS